MVKEAKYKTMQKDILARILSGQFPAKRLPPLKQLAESYKVSLMTANKVVKLLEETGIVQCSAGNIGTLIDEKKVSVINAQMSRRHVWRDINQFIEPEVAIKYLCTEFAPKFQAVKDELASCFNARYPWIKIDFESSDCIEHDLAENRCFDVIQLFGRDVRSYQQRGILADISPAVSEFIDDGQLFDNAFANCIVDGRYYALPLLQNVPVVYYNKKYFGASGICLTESWDSFLKAAESVVTRKSHTALNMGLSSFMHCFVGDIRNLANLSVNREALTQAINILKYITLSAPDDLALHPKSVVKDFLARKVYFFCAYSSHIGQLTEECGFDWGFLPMPKTPGGSPAMLSAVNGINQASKRKKEAWLLINFLCSREAQDILARERNCIPVNRASFDHVYHPQNPADAQILKGIIDEAIPGNVSSQDLYTIYSYTYPVLENFYGTNCSPEDTIEELLRRVREMLFLERLAFCKA